MKSITITVALFLGLISASATEDEAYTDSYDDCLRFASEFDNTCTDNAAALDFASVPTQDVTCQLTGKLTCPNGGTMDSQYNCVFPRKLCVTCRQEGGQVKIRTQSDGQPNHCMMSPKMAVKQFEIDYEATWLSSTEPYAGEALDQSSLDELICNLMRSLDANIPASAGYRNLGATRMNTGWGIATTGVMIFNGSNVDSVDPFYPAVYGGSTDLTAEKVDRCLGHPQAQGMFHYHSASPCLADPSLFTTSPMTTDVLSQMRAGWKTKPYRSVVGLAKDGRPIYSPNYGNMKEYEDCEVDVCNGMTIGGHYAYVGTYFHPYIMGCFGPGDSARGLSQACSRNARACNVDGTSGRDPAGPGSASSDDGATGLGASISALALLFLSILQ